MDSRTATMGVMATTALMVAYNIFSKRSAKNTKKKLKPLVVCGPSGVGKGTLLELLMKEFPGVFAKCVSHTTRAPRAGEVDKEHYNFSSVDAMRKEIAEGKFIEYAEVHGNIYGTSIKAVDDVAAAGRICILEIDVQGAELVRKTPLDPVYLFLLPPSFDTLEARLRARNSETEESLKKRLLTAKTELDFMAKCEFVDHKLVNNNLDEAYADLRAFILTTYPSLQK